ncbi:MAG TPA: riboflavin synthase [Mycobacteriales bacterium]|jgi:riboflavin synthase|nr:riboflavin synthase [Mycobacteriales bacterium]
MFTGIVEALGAVEVIGEQVDAVRLTITGDTLKDLSGGESVAVNGVCLTVADIHDSGFTADVMRETLRRTTLGGLAAGDQVNLERSVTPTTRLGGHIVQGHVDGVAQVVATRPSEHWREVDLELPVDLLRYVVEKGSIALDGVSLTVASVEGNVVGVSLIPETLARTTFGRRDVGGSVNVEVDVLAKYVERLLTGRESA